MSDVVVTVSGVGTSREVTVETGASLEDTLAEAGLNAEAQGTDVRVNGEAVSPEYAVQDGDQVSATPQGAKLGS